MKKRKKIIPYRNQSKRFTEAIDKMAVMKEEDLNAYFLDLLENAGLADRKKLAEALRNSSIYSTDEQFTTIEGDPALRFYQIFFTCNGTDITVKPEIIRFVLEEFTPEIFALTNKNFWLDLIMGFFGEVALDYLNDDGTIEGEADLNRFVEEFYRKNGFGNPKAVKGYIDHFLQILNEGNTIDHSQSDLVYSSIMTNLRIKARLENEDHFCSKNGPAVKKLLKVYNKIKRRPMLLSQDPYNYLNFSATEDVSMVYLDLMMRALVEDKYKDGYRFLKNFSTEAKKFKDVIDYYYGIVGKFLALIDRIVNKAIENGMSPYSLTRWLSYFLDILEILTADLPYGPESQDIRWAMRTCSHLLIRICEETSLYLTLAKERIFDGSMYEKLGLDGMTLIQVVESGLTLEEVDDQLHKAEKILNENMEYYKNQILNGSDDPVNFNEYISCARPIVNFCVKREDYEKTLDFLLGSLKFLETAKKQRIRIPPGLTAALFFTKLYLASIYLQPDQDLAKAKKTLMSCREEFKVMEKLAKENRSIVAFQLIILFCKLMSEYSELTGNGSSRKTFTKRMNDYSKLALKLIPDYKDVENTVDYNWIF